jgi:hypothetical protein
MPNVAMDIRCCVSACEYMIACVRACTFHYTLTVDLVARVTILSLPRWVQRAVELLVEGCGERAVQLLSCRASNTELLSCRPSNTTRGFTRFPIS